MRAQKQGKQKSKAAINNTARLSINLVCFSTASSTPKDYYSPYTYFV